MDIATTTAVSAAFLELSPMFVLLVPIVIALVQGAKQFVDLGRWSAIVSLAFGVGLSFLVSEVAWNITVLQGILVGLSASGLYSGTRSTFK